MKLKFLLILLFLFNNLISKAQTGINYSPTNTENSELIINRRNTIPELRINTGQTGMQPNQVLVSDDYGNVSWRTVNLDNKLAISGSFGAGVTKDYYGTTTYNHYYTSYSGAYITLPPGRWAVNLNFNVDIKILTRPNNTSSFVESNITNAHNFWVRVVLSDNNNNNEDYNSTSTSDRLISNLYLASGLLKGPTSTGLVKGEIFINNTTGSNKNYYLKVCVEKNASTLYGENQGFRLKNFALGPDYESNGADRFYALPIGI